MTQAQLSQWLGVTIKQVKYLEHERRKPSGPTRRLLEILARELKFGDAGAVQVLGASPTQLKKTAPAPDSKIALVKPDDNRRTADSPVTTATEETAIAGVDVPSPAAAGDAFVWQ